VNEFTEEIRALGPFQVEREPAAEAVEA